MATTWVYQRLQERMFAQRQERGDDDSLMIWGAGVDERVYIFDESSPSSRS